MPSPPSPDPPPEQERARQKRWLYLAMGLFIFYAVVLIAVPITKIPLAFRVLGAALNLIMAAVLWFVVRQKLDGK